MLPHELRAEAGEPGCGSGCGGCLCFSQAQRGERILAAKRLEPSAHDESGRAGTQKGQLAELLRAADLKDVEESVLVVSTSFDDFDDWWDPFTLGVGPAGAYVLDRDAEGQALLRDQCRALLPRGPFTQEVSAWVVRGQA